MNHKIAIYGLTEDRISHLVAALPEGYEVTSAECVTALIVTNVVCTVIDAANMGEDALRVLLAYCMDVGDRLDETVIWVGDAEIPDLPFFMRCDSFLDLLTNLDHIIAQAQTRYDTMQMYGSDYAFLPRRTIEESTEADIYAALYHKYGEKPDPVILKRMRQEWTALMEIDAVSELAAVYELTLWLRNNGHPYWIGGCAPSGFIPYLLGISRVNPLPPELGGHHLVWQEYASYGREPSYVFHLAADLQPQITAWLENHWLKKFKGNQWTAAQPYEDHLVRGNMHFLFKLDTKQNQAVEEIPSLCREDIYFYLKKHGFADKDAFRGMCSVRKGRGFPVITDEMRAAEDCWILEECKNVKWLNSRANLLERMIYKKHVLE